jgi:hypothetical protein
MLRVIILIVVAPCIAALVITIDKKSVAIFTSNYDYDRLLNVIMPTRQK